MARRKGVLATAAVFAVVASLSAQAQVSTVELMRTATYVFQGTITKGADPGGPAVARIDEIYWGADSGGGAPGEKVRIFVRGAVKEGESHVWFADVTAWRDLLELREIDRRPAQSRDAVVRDVRSAAAAVADERVAAHLAEADAVIEGEVVSARGTNDERRSVRSEHDPLWAPAEIAVTRVLRGDVGKRVTVLYPTSDDIAWTHAPKLTVGQKGVFVLHRTAPRALPQAAAAVFYLVTYQDFYPPAEVPRIRKLVTRSGQEVKP
jgi:hypothetical protein